MPCRWRRRRRPLAAALGLSLALGSGGPGCGGKTGLEEPAPAEAPAAAETGGPSLPMAEGAADLSAGLFHTCVVRPAGDAWCWGFNNAGQLGDGTDEGRHRPVRVAGLGPVARVSAGRAHTCAFTSSGEAWCWGGNRYGQLGSAAHDLRSLEPVPVGLPAEVVDLSAGGQHTCALTADGAVLCWGDGRSGQLGGGMDPTHRSRFAQPDLLAASAVSAGWLHTCAVLRDGGEVRCWGDNHAGQLGRDSEDIPASVEPIPVPLPAGAVAVSAGDHHSCATLTSGEVWCWGDDRYGQLGDGVAGVTAGPVRAVGLGDAVAVSAGHEHSCALRRGGEVWCWGRAEHGQLGLVTDAPYVTTPSPVGGLADVVQIAMGWRHGCARRVTGEVSCWGRNVEGQLAASSAMRQTPTSVPLP